jgi:hypothetical protein
MKTGMLQKVRAKVKPGPDGGFVAGAGGGATQDHRMPAIKAGRAEIVVEPVHREALVWMEIVFAPVPDVAGDVMHTEETVAASCNLFALMYSHTFFVTSVRGSGVLPITAANSGEGVRGLLKPVPVAAFTPDAFFAAGDFFATVTIGSPD